MENLNNLITQADNLTYGGLMVVVLIAAAIFGTVFYKMANPKLK